MFLFVYFKKNDEPRNYFKDKLVRPNPYDTIFVPYGHLPIPVDSSTHEDRFGNYYDVPMDDNDDRKIYFMIDNSLINKS